MALTKKHLKSEIVSVLHKIHITETITWPTDLANYSSPNTVQMIN